MSTTTTKLGLFKYQSSDKDLKFNIDKALNANWDKVDNLPSATDLENVKKAKASTITLQSSQWVADNDNYKLEYSLSWVTSNDVLVVDLIPSEDDDTRESELSAWSTIYSIKTDNGKIVFKASEEIDTDLSVTFVLGGVLNG